jgi:hypothetical protein
MRSSVHLITKEEKLPTILAMVSETILVSMIEVLLDLPQRLMLMMAIIFDRELRMTASMSTARWTRFFLRA